MSFIKVNLEETPDKFEQVPAGVYLCSVEEAKQEPTKDGQSMKVVVTLKITEGSMENRQLFDHIGLKGGKPINLKRLCMAAGVSFTNEGVDLNELLGKFVKVRVKARSYVDKDTGETKETTSIAEYLVEGESK